MKLPHSLFDGRDLAEVQQELVSGKTLTSGLGFTLVLDTNNGRLVAKHPKLEAMSFTAEVALSQAILSIYRGLYDAEILEGFQVVTDDGETYERWSFEVLSYTVGLHEWKEAAKLEPDEGWMLDPLLKGTVEEPTFVYDD